MDFKTELKKLNELKVLSTATDLERSEQAERVAQAFNFYSVSITPKNKKPKTLSAKHFLTRYIPC